MDEIEKIYITKCNKISDINELLPILKKYAEDSESITEMGVRSIVSTWAFLAGKPKKMISIDLEHPSFFIKHDKDGCDIDVVKKLSEKNGIYFQFIQGNTLEIEIDPCDFLFIDTLHNYSHLKKELIKHAPKIKKYIAFHDTETFGLNGEEPGENGIKKAIDEFLEENKNWNICEKVIYNNGLIVIKKNDD